MTAMIEVRTYRATPGSREILIEALRNRAIPVHREIGMKVLGPFASREDEDTFVWLRAFPDDESREPMKEAFYGGRLWLEELEGELMPLIAHYESVLVEDTAGMWDSWPENARQLAAIDEATTVIVETSDDQELPPSQPIIYDRPIGMRLLHQDPRSGEEHYLVRYPAGLGVQRHRHTAAHTIVVLEGSLVVNGRVVGPGAYCHFPAGQPMHHAPKAEGPCLFLNVFHGPADVYPAED
jgi:quercetin dioxygenase-like cupin family protein